MTPFQDESHYSQALPVDLKVGGDIAGSQVCAGWNALPDPIIFDS